MCNCSNGKEPPKEPTARQNLEFSEQEIEQDPRLKRLIKERESCCGARRVLTYEDDTEDEEINFEGPVTSTPYCCKKAPPRTPPPSPSPGQNRRCELAGVAIVRRIDCGTSPDRRDEISKEVTPTGKKTKDQDKNEDDEKEQTEESESEEKNKTVEKCRRKSSDKEKCEKTKDQDKTEDDEKEKTEESESEEKKKTVEKCRRKSSDKENCEKTED